MAWFDPLNNSGGVTFDFFDFTYLSIPPTVKHVLTENFPIGHMGPEGPSNQKKILILFFQAKLSEIAK